MSELFRNVKKNIDITSLLHKKRKKSTSHWYEKLTIYETVIILEIDCIKNWPYETLTVKIDHIKIDNMKH